MGVHERREPAGENLETEVTAAAPAATPWYRRPRNLAVLAVAAAAVAAAVTVPSIMNDREKSEDSGFSSEMVDGKAKTIQDYFKGNGITATQARPGEPGTPKITLGLPDNWADAGPDTPAWAYGEAFMKDSADPNDPATVDVLLSKLSGEVDQAQIINFAPGELRNLPDYKSLQQPERSTLSGFEAVALGGLYTRDGQERIIAQKTVVIPTEGGVFVLQINADAPKGDAPALQFATGVMDEQAKIAP